MGLPSLAIGSCAMAQSTPQTISQTKGKCPICRAPTEPDSRPFCSRRCADVDLSRWLRGAYVIQGASQDDDEDGDGADAPHERLPEEPNPQG